MAFHLYINFSFISILGSFATFKARAVAANTNNSRVCFVENAIFSFLLEIASANLKSVFHFPPFWSCFILKRTVFLHSSGRQGWLSRLQREHLLRGNRWSGRNRFKGVAEMLMAVLFSWAFNVSWWGWPREISIFHLMSRCPSVCDKQWWKKSSWAKSGAQSLLALRWACGLFLSCRWVRSSNIPGSNRAWIGRAYTPMSRRMSILGKTA